VESLVIGIAGGVGVALVLWLVRAPGEVRDHDRLLAERDEDLGTWVADEHLELERELGRILERLSAQNLLWSSTRLAQRAGAKEQVLHAYRDQERQARRFRAELEAREEWPHKVWRKLRGGPLPTLTASERVQPILDVWREAESYEGSPICEVSDPTRRTLETALDELKGRDTSASA
jgi:hypothetical protein